MITYNAALSECEKGGIPHQTLQLLTAMQQQNIMPAVITYNAVNNAFEQRPKATTGAASFTKRMQLQPARALFRPGRDADAQETAVDYFNPVALPRRSATSLGSELGLPG